MGDLKMITKLKEFKEKLEEAGDKLVVVDFYAEWCGPCRQISPKVERLEEIYKDKVVVLKVDMDEVDENFSDELGIQCMPTFHYYRRKTKITEFSGANEAKLRELVEKCLEDEGLSKACETQTPK